MCSRICAAISRGAPLRACPSAGPNLGEAYKGHRYLAMRLDSRDLAGVDPFALLASGIPAARKHMENWSLAVIGMPRGFVLLAGHVNPATNDNAASEEMLDLGCALAKTM